MSKKLSPSEIRGILIVACISLTVIGFGFFVALTDINEPSAETGSVEIIVRGDTIGQQENEKQISRKRGKKKFAGKKKSKKTYRKRSPMDEPAEDF